MTQSTCKVIGQRRVAPGHYVMELEAPQIARSAKPGQFVQILCDPDPAGGACCAPLLPRPFSFFDAGKRRIMILYHVVGKGTAILERVRPGDRLQVSGPFGNGFTLREGKGQKAEGRRVILVGGGVGIPPLFHLAKVMLQKKMQKPSDVTVLLGARNKSLLLCQNEFKKLGVNLSVATDDGSRGKRGFVTELLETLLRLPSPISHLPSRLIYTCGPTAMMRAVSALAQKFEVPCQVSVEVPMACGFGACLGCALKVRTLDPRPKTLASQDNDKKDSSQSSDFRYAIACCEGPVFEGSQILWD